MASLGASGNEPEAILYCFCFFHRHFHNTQRPTDPASEDFWDSALVRYTKIQDMDSLDFSLPKTDSVK